LDDSPLALQRLAAGATLAAARRFSDNLSACPRPAAPPKSHESLPPMLARLPEELIKELDHMMERLNKGDVDERQFINTRLLDYEKSGKIPLEALLEMADEGNPTMSMYAVGALGRSKHPAAVQKLLALAEDYRTRHPMFTETVVDALGETGDKAATMLLMDFLGVKSGWKNKLRGKFSLKKEEPTEEEKAFRTYIVLPAIRALAKLADPRAAEAFAACLEHDEALVRWHAIQGIVACGLTDFIPRLQQIGEKDGNDLVRERAQIAVESMRTPPPRLVN
jgi:HEAT repeat protein